MGLNQLDILVLQAVGVHFLVVIVIVLLSLSTLDGLAGLAVAVVVVVIVAGVVVLAARLSELGGSGLLGSRVQILDLGLTEDTNRCISYLLQHSIYMLM